MQCVGDKQWRRKLNAQDIGIQFWACLRSSFFSIQTFSLQLRKSIWVAKIWVYFCST